MTEEINNRLFEFTENCRDFIETLPYPVSIHDLQFNVIAANRRFLELAATGAPGKCYEMIHCTDMPPENCPALKSIKTGRGESAELYEPILDKYLLVQTQPILREGVIIGATHTITDITKVKKSEQEFKELTEVLGDSLDKLKKREQELLKSREAFLNMLEDVTQSYSDLEELFIGLVRALVSALDAKSQWTKGHSDRVSRYAEKIASELSLDEDYLKNIRLAGLLHDIGKIGTYDHLLDKPSRLTTEEFTIVKRHPSQGADILSSIKQLKSTIPFIRHHHERFDGKGYPDGLKGEEIPLGARILCVADTFDAIMADRPYRPSPGLEYAVSELKKFSGIQFDPGVADAFLKIIEREGIQ